MMLCFTFIIVMMLLLVTLIPCGAYHYHHRNISIVMNPFVPLQLFKPPCIFKLLHDGGASCGPLEEKDHFGLCSPCKWDCQGLGKGSDRIDYHYDEYMPSRRAACNCYCRGGAKDSCLSTFVVDDEMEQVLTILDAININTPHFTTVEIGSRQGQWVLKASALAKRMQVYKSVYGFSVELSEKWKARQVQKIKMNGLEDVVTLSDKLITPANYPAMIKDLTMRSGTWQPITHMDWDCQGCEQMLATPEAFELYEKNVLHLFIAIHDKNAEALYNTYKRDILDYSGEPYYGCDEPNRQGLANNRGFVTEDKNCLKNSNGFGPIYYRDGTLRVFNSKLFNQLNLTLKLPNCLPANRSTHQPPSFEAPSKLLPQIAPNRPAVNRPAHNRPNIRAPRGRIN